MAAKHSTHHSFCATVLDSRLTPSQLKQLWLTTVDPATAWLASDPTVTWLASVQESFDKVLGGTTSTIQATSLTIDEHGALLLVDFQMNMQLCNARRVVSKLLKDFPPPQCDRALQTFHSLDEYDKERIEGMRTVAACEPPPPEQESRPYDRTEWVKATKGKTLAEKIAAFEAENGETPDDEAPTWQAPITSLVPIESRLVECTAKVQETEAFGRATVNWARMVHESLENWCLANANPKFFNLLTNCGDPTWNLADLETHTLAITTAAKDNAQRFEIWKEIVAAEAAVVVASAGVHSLTFERCYKPERRKLLLAKRLTSKTTLLKVVQTAWKMVVLGQFSKPGDPKQRYQLLQMCREVLITLNPTAPNVVKDLPRSEQTRVIAALSGEEPQEDNPTDTFPGCFGCMTEDPEWVVQDTSIDGASYVMSRCANCQTLKAFGRSFKSIRDIVASSLMRDMPNGPFMGQFLAGSLMGDDWPIE